MVVMIGIVEVTIKAHHHRNHSFHRIFCIGDLQDMLQKK